MKSNFVFSSSSLFIGLFLFFFTENVCSQESADNWTLKQARQWTQKQEWANGLKAMPHKTTDYQEFASQYHKNKKVWDKTFQWLATHDLVNMPAGRYEVDGEHCYINVQDATTQDVSKRKIEAHRHGIDLQYVVKVPNVSELLQPNMRSLSPNINRMLLSTKPKNKICRFHSGHILHVLP